MKCEDCTWGVVGKPNAVIYREVVCHRYPTLVNKMKVDFCAEFTQKTAKNYLKDRKKLRK